MPDLFSSVPALLPDASNLHEVFDYIDYEVFKKCDNSLLEEHKKLMKISDMEPHSWYAVRNNLHPGVIWWWSVYYDGQDFYTICRGRMMSDEKEFMQCTVVVYSCYLSRSELV